MFQSVISQAQSAVQSTLDKYVGLAAVALALLIATGFATAAAMIWLVQTYGAIIACLAAAGFFAVIALMIAAFATNALAEVEAIATGEDVKSSEKSQTANGGQSLDGLDVTKFVTDDPVTALSIVTTIVGVLKGMNRRTALVLVIAGVGAVAYFLMLQKRSGPAMADGPSDLAASGTAASEGAI